MVHEKTFYYPDGNHSVSNPHTGEILDEAPSFFGQPIDQVPVGAHELGLENCTQAGRCLVRAMRRSNMISVSCFPGSFDTVAQATAQESTCKEVHELIHKKAAAHMQNELA